MVCADKKVDVFQEGHHADDVLPVLAQRALRAAQERNEVDTAEIAALVEHELNFMQVRPGSLLWQCQLYLQMLLLLHGSKISKEETTTAGR